ncbi:hypothetical protein KHQ81_11360 [Mycoplasmatota bacterium]|nr:hypothetical protein KHQ81_11360 [Mycoplasmatota bacterium]
MKNTEFEVNISVKEAFDLLEGSDIADLVDTEFKELGDGKQLGILIFGKYYMRVKNRVSLVVIIDNIDGYTKVKAIGSGGGRSFFTDFDWGASDSFENEVERLFNETLRSSNS